MADEVKIIIVNKGTESQWESSEARTLESGEFGYATDTDELKIGNGSDPFSERPAFLTEKDIAEDLDGGETDKAPSVSAINAALGGKVEKESGKGLSEANFTADEKQKLASLESSKFKGEFTSLEALEEITGSAGSYAYVDEGEGEDVTAYIWDTTDGVWVDQKGVTTAETSASVKQKYEANPDTNAFTNAEKTKLSGIQANAQANPNDATASASGLMSASDKAALDMLAAKHGSRISGGNPTMKLTDYEALNSLSV